jgi:hypothetical protein
MEAVEHVEEKGKMVKLPIPHEKARFNEIYIRGNRPLPVYIKHAHKVLIKHNCIIIHAMTAAIDKAVRLHVHLMEEYPYLNAQIVTTSVPSITNNDGNFELKERSAIHITLTKA